eukprot:Skav228471  [mRNA]  locus=scaffold2004:9145:9645:+ [translate_table: standard]
MLRQDRTDAMRLAVLEAQAREMDAKEKLSRSPQRRGRESRHSSPLSGRSPHGAPPHVPLPISRSAVVFGTAPRIPVAPVVSPVPMAPPRQRSNSPCPCAVVKMPPARMGLPELKQNFTELKNSTTSLKHQLQALQARAIEELTRSADTTVTPPSGPSEQADLISSA